MTIVEITCDESGAEGENLSESIHGVFCHGSTDLTREAAREVMDRVRESLKSESAEVKSAQLLRETNRSRKTRDWLMSQDGPLAGRASMYLVDKNYLLVAKIIDLLVEDVAHENGVDLYARGRARTIAVRLYQWGERDLKQPLWGELLQSFNSLMRIRQRRGNKTTIEEFFEVVDRCRRASHRAAVRETLSDIMQTRPYADDIHRKVMEIGAPDLDPLLAAIPVVLTYWHARYRSPLRLVHDEQNALQYLNIEEIRKPLAEFAHFRGAVPLENVVEVSSRSDERVQVADLVAGLGRAAGTAALGGGTPVPPCGHLLNTRSLWADEDSWARLLL